MIALTEIMLSQFAAINISPIGLILLSTALLILFLLLGVFIVQQKKQFTSSDGKRFSSEKDFLAYEAILKKIMPLYDCLQGEKLAEEALGLQSGFLKLLKEKGFSEIKTFMDYRNDFRKIAELLEE